MATHIPKNKIYCPYLVVRWYFRTASFLWLCRLFICLGTCYRPLPSWHSRFHFRLICGALYNYLLFHLYLHRSDLISYYFTLPSLRFDPLTYLLLLEYSRNTPVSRPLYLLFPLIGTFFPQIFIGSLPRLQASPQMSHSWWAFPINEITSFKITALSTHSTALWPLLCFCSSSGTEHALTYYIFYFFLNCLLPEECKLHESKPMYLFCSLFNPQCLTQSRNSINTCWKNKVNSPILFKTWMYHWTIMWERGIKQEMRASSWRIVCYIRYFEFYKSPWDPVKT